MKEVEVTVFLVSLKAGGVALNLTEASRVYLMDSWWNPAVSQVYTSCIWCPYCFPRLSTVSERFEPPLPDLSRLLTCP